MKRLKSITPESALHVLSEIYGEDQGAKFWSEINDNYKVHELPTEFAKLINGIMDGHLQSTDNFRCEPVGLEEFMFEPFYLGQSREEIWPEVFKELIELNSGKYIEAIIKGDIGNDKPTIALGTQA